MGEELDAELWSKLPAEILDLVLRRLPFSALCRFRAVCKHWNTLPTVCPAEPYLLDIPRQTITDPVTCLRHCRLYSPTANTWEFLDLSFLPVRMSQLCSWPLSWAPQIERFCSDGGLLCLLGKFVERGLRVFGRWAGDTYHSLFVCNPLTRSCKLLPPFSLEDHGALDLAMHRESTGAYKIFAVVLVYTGEPGVLLRHYMYESGSGSWKLILALRRDCTDNSVLRYCSIVFEGVYYCVSGGGRQPYDLHAYDIKQDCWVAVGVKTNLDVPKTTKVSFVVSNERLLLIASLLEGRWCLSISTVDLCRTETILSPSAESVVSLPANFTWNGGFALACRDNAILLASSSKSMAVDLLSLSADLKELKPVTPMSVIPTSKGYKHGITMAKASFDVQATL